MNHVKAKIEDGVTRAVVLVGEKANENYSTDFISRLYNEDGKGSFTAKTCVLGHVQQVYAMMARFFIAVLINQSMGHLWNFGNFRAALRVRSIGTWGRNWLRPPWNG